MGGGENQMQGVEETSDRLQRRRSDLVAFCREVLGVGDLQPWQVCFLRSLDASDRLPLLFAPRFGLFDVWTCASIPRTTLSNWLNRDHLILDVAHNPGTGALRRFTGLDILVLTVLREINSLFVPLEKLKSAQGKLRDHVRAWALSLATQSTPQKPPYILNAYPTDSGWNFETTSNHPGTVLRIDLEDVLLPVIDRLLMSAAGDAKLVE